MICHLQIHSVGLMLVLPFYGKCHSFHVWDGGDIERISSNSFCATLWSVGVVVVYVCGRRVGVVAVGGLDRVVFVELGDQFR